MSPEEANSLISSYISTGVTAVLALNKNGFSFLSIFMNMFSAARAIGLVPCSRVLVLWPNPIKHTVRDAGCWGQPPAHTNESP